MGWVYSGLEHQELERSYSDRELLVRVIKQLAPYKKGFFLVLSMVLVETALTLVSPIVLAQSLSNLAKENPNRTLIFILAGIYLFMIVLRFGTYYLQNYGMAKMVPGFMVDLRTGVFNRIQQQDLKFFDKRRSGRLTSRVGSDAAETGNIIMLLATFGGNFLLIFITFVILFQISAQLSKLVLIVVPLVIVFTWFFRRIARRLSKIYRESIAEVNAGIAESIEGISIAKSYGREQETVTRFKDINDSNYRAGFRQGVGMELLFPTMDLFYAIGVVIILQVGGLWVYTGENSMDVATLYLFIVYLQQFFFPLMQMSTFYSQMQAGFAAYERILEVNDSIPEVKANPGGKVIENMTGDIKFQNVNFEYKKGTPVLEDFNLHIKPGEKLAIVGHTGAGKSTLANLISRFYEFQGGQILIDDIDIRDLDLKAYRTNLGIVQQEPFLFSGTVEENIIYGNWDASDEEVQQAISAVHADEFISYLPNGLKTSVGERGSMLSTGQRQLICFARAVLADPAIMLLDEATSAIDAYTEAVIQEALEVLFENRTSIIIAHRLSTVVNADRIIVLDHGKILEQGSHDELMLKGGKYQELYETYFKHQALLPIEVESDN